MKKWIVIIVATTAISFYSGVRWERARIQRGTNEVKRTLIQDLDRVAPGMGQRVKEQTQ